METYKLKTTERFVVLLASWLLRLIGATLRMTEVGHPAIRPRIKTDPPFLWAFWHESILLAAFSHQDLGIRIMISASRDGELIAQFSGKFGLVPVRGSTSRGGREAARALADALKAGHDSALTPDGPRGPRRKAQPGAALIARVSGRSVVPFAFAADRAWRLKSWDRFMIPKPFARCVVVYGEPISFHRGEPAQEMSDRLQAGMDKAQADAEKFFGS